MSKFFTSDEHTFTQMSNSNYCGNHSNKCVVFDKFLLIRQKHNFVSKVKIDCEWNAQLHLVSNGELVEMMTLSRMIASGYIDGQQTKVFFNSMNLVPIFQISKYATEFLKF